jgi:hypothetical protein
MRYKIYQFSNYGADEIPTDRDDSPAYGKNYAKLIDLVIRDRDNEFESLDEAIAYVQEDEGLRRYPNLTVLPIIIPR